MRYLCVIFIFSMLMGCASTAVSSADPAPSSEAKLSTTQTAEQEVKQDDTSNEKLICRNEQAVGSNKKVRTCRKVSGT
ncbi:hypothetical protein [Rheinheimera sp. NSM]|uniref:hypothetical protein n=1 Tax=Rheinheimera sp. NSM TaxID=3457884 RepID=UPI00403675E2